MNAKTPTPLEQELYDALEKLCRYENRTCDVLAKFEAAYPKPLTIELSLDEAETLSAILCNIGGDPQKSRRQHADAVRDRLHDAGLPDHHNRARRDQPRPLPGHHLLQGSHLMNTTTHKTTAVPLLTISDIEGAMAAGARIEFTACGCGYDLPPHNEPGSRGWIRVQRTSAAQYKRLGLGSAHARLRAFYPTKQTRIARLKARVLAMLLGGRR